MSRLVSRNVASEIAAIEKLDRAGCVEGWRRRFGYEPPKYVSMQFMRRALVFETQVKAHGGHSQAVRRTLARVLKNPRPPRNGANLAQTTPVMTLSPGIHLIREWNGRSYQVEVLENGFRMDGKPYRSLSAIARKITGAHWSGPRFFGLDAP